MTLGEAAIGMAAAVAVAFMFLRAAASCRAADGAANPPPAKRGA